MVLAFRKIFASLDQMNILHRTFTPVNGHLELLGEFGRSLILGTRRLRVRNFSNSSSNDRRRNLLPNLRNII
jgi:hypothetical protein